MGLLFTNNADTTLNGAITAGATSLTVQTGAGALFPQPQTFTDYFYITLFDGTNREVCQCTARSGDVFTIIRGLEGTTPFAFANGSVVSHRLTAGTIAELLRVGRRAN